MLSEFALIDRYFTRSAPPAGSANSAIQLGIGDDCALLAATPGSTLAISTDMLVEGRHFFTDCDATALGHKALAVNLSDLAAMGARPLAFTLALALPDANEVWLARFSQGLFALADQHHCALVGGDTTKGPLTICITVFGELIAGQALRRDAAQVGDEIWVSGTLGDARLALAGRRAEISLDAATQHSAALRMDQPTPRISLGLALAGVAHAAIDISDGLAGDLGHILQRSRCGATLDIEALPISPMLQQQAIDLQRRFALCGGDDYELCFTAPTSARAAVQAAATRSATMVTRIGQIDAALGLRLQQHDRSPYPFHLTSFDHFSTP